MRLSGSVLRRALLPGLVLQSVIVGGGYATGREFAEFFLANGPLGGAFAMAIATLLISAVYATSLEFARVHQCFEYRGFFGALLGRGWIVFEVLYILLSVLVLSVIAATAGTVLNDFTGVASWIGTLGFTIVTALVTALGSHQLERMMAASALLLMIFYFVLVIVVLGKFGGDAQAQWAMSPPPDVASSAFDGVRYAGYNLASITATLFCARALTSRADCISAGLLGGVLAMAPGAFFFFGMVSFMPAILDEPAPITMILKATGVPSFSLFFMLVLVATLVATGAGFLHSINERLGISRSASSRQWSASERVVTAGALLVVSAFIAGEIGLVGLVGRGYGLITFGFLAVFVVPILTVGWWRILRKAEAPGDDFRTDRGAER